MNTENSEIRGLNHIANETAKKSTMLHLQRYMEVFREIG